MFNLEQAMSEWRCQMLAAGIKSPVPLEELEIHLREEIDRHTRSGLDVAEAFKVAVENIGQGHVLQKEFEKVENDHSVMRAVLLIIGWIAASCALLYGVLLWELDWNLFRFHPEWNVQLIRAMVGILVGLTASWFLAKASLDRATWVVSLLLCVLVAALAVSGLHADESATGVFGGHIEIPFWYRGGRTLLLCLPSVFWVWWTRRRASAAGKQRAR